jgi:glycosyltransferase involved in cell wall biosynthesis
MRLLFVLDQWPELSETFVVNELQALRRIGHVVDVQAVRHAEHPNPEAPEDVALFVLSRDGRSRQLLDVGWLAARHPLGCLLDLVHRSRWRGEEWVRPLRMLAPVARRLERDGVEHLHAHFAAGAALDALRLGALTRRPFSVTAHAYDIFMTPRNLRTKLEAADAVFTGCDYNVDHLRHAAPGARVHKVIMGVDAQAFARRTPLPGGHTVLAIGRLTEKKGFDVLVDAASSLGAGARVRIIGDGPLRGELESRIEASGAPVELLGSQPPAQVRLALEEADVLAMPCVVSSDGDRDSMPVVVKEAMAMGLLVVASDEVGLPECVLAPWGFLAAPGDAGALARALRAALALGPQERRRAGEQARAWVMRHAHVDSQTARMSAVIEQIRRR